MLGFFHGRLPSFGCVFGHAFDSLLGCGIRRCHEARDGFHVGDEEVGLAMSFRHIACGESGGQFGLLGGDGGPDFRERGGDDDVFVAMAVCVTFAGLGGSGEGECEDDGQVFHGCVVVGWEKASGTSRAAARRPYCQKTSGRTMRSSSVLVKRPQKMTTATGCKISLPG